MEPNTPAPVSTPADPKNSMLMNVLSYLGILAIIPFIMAKNDPAVKFHLKQGLVLLVIEAVVWVLGMFLNQLWFIYTLVNLATLILAIIGIINVVNHQEKELPIVGAYAKKFTF